MSEFEVTQRIAERISDHNILNPNELWKCQFCGKWGQGFRNFAYHVAEEVVADLGVNGETRWVPTTYDGKELPPVTCFADAEYAMKGNNKVGRVDREYRFVSRWFRPSRDG